MQPDPTRHSDRSLLRAYLRRVARHPAAVLVICLALCAAGAVQIPKIKINANVNAFLSPSDPVLLFRSQVEEKFGLGDGLVVLLERNEPGGVYHPNALQALDELGRALSGLEGIEPGTVKSLATENNVSATEDGIAIKPFVEGVSMNESGMQRLRQRVESFPALRDTLVSRDGKATALVVEIVEPETADRIYNEASALTKDCQRRFPDMRFYIAGESAVNSQLGFYINSDMARLNILCAATIALTLLAAFRSWQGVAFPMLTVGGTMAVTLGAMGLRGDDFFVITNALPVILVAIGVADGIHIMGEFDEVRKERPGMDAAACAVESILRVFRPITITSITDVAGFLSMGIAFDMPPMKAFGFYAALGSVAAWIFSMTLLPACLCLWPRRSNRAALASDWFGRCIDRWICRAQRHARAVIGAALLLAIGAGALATQVRVDENRIENFKESEPIHRADDQVRAHMGGSSHLYLICRTDEREGWLAPDRLKRLERIQSHVESLPEVASAYSVIDVLKKISSVLDDEESSQGELPVTSEMAAQYLLLYSVSSEPDSLKSFIDYDYQTCVLRVLLRSGQYTEQARVLDKIQKFFDEQKGGAGIEFRFSGRPALDVHWVSRLKGGHFTGVLLALGAVGLALSLMFRSLRLGLTALLPVSFSILMIYAVMGATGIWLNVGSSMFAAIAIGTGVDFAVYVLYQFERTPGADFRQTGRSLLFNFLSVFLGFGLLTTSHVPPLITFGILITTSILVSFLASLLLLPALSSWRRGVRDQ